METRTQACLDAQDDHIRTISTQLETLHHTQECHYSTLQETQEKFKTMVLQWMKHLEKQPMTREENQSLDYSSMLPNSSTPSPHPHSPGQSSTPTLHPHVAGHSSTPMLPTHVVGHHPQEFARPFQFHDALHMTKKVKLTTFSNTDPQGWLTRAETYIQVLNVPDHLRVPLAHICMEGVAEHWFSILRESHNPLSWADFQKE